MIYVTKYFIDKFTYKSSRKFLQLYGLFWKTSLLSKKNFCGYIFGRHLEKLGYFLL